MCVAFQYFPDDQGAEHFVLCFVKRLLAFCPFLSLFGRLVLSWGSCLCLLDINPLSDMFYKYFLPFHVIIVVFY